MPIIVRRSIARRTFLREFGIELLGISKKKGRKPGHYLACLSLYCDLGKKRSDEDKKTH